MKMRLSFLALAMPAAAGLVMATSTASNAAALTGNVQLSGAGVNFTPNSLDFTDGSNNGGAGIFTNVFGTGDLSILTGTTAAIKDLAGSPFSNSLADETINLAALGASVNKFITFSGPGPAPNIIDFRLTRLRRVVETGRVSFFLDGFLRNNGAIPGKDNTNVVFDVSVLTGQPGAPLCAATACTDAEATAFFASSASTGFTGISGALVAGSARKIPEPMTMLGSGLAIASIAALKRKKKSNALKLATSES
jgi:hypothetical protein